MLWEQIRLNQPIDGGSSCESTNCWWRFLWVNLLMMAIRVNNRFVVAIRVNQSKLVEVGLNKSVHDGGLWESNWLWMFVWFDKLMVELLILQAYVLLFYFTCVYGMLLFRVLFVFLSFLGLRCLYICILWCKVWSK